MGESMRAVVIREFGDADALELREVARPVPGRGEVRVRVAASGVNRADVLQRRGAYPAPPGEPRDIPGLELSGTVESVGPGCLELEPGRRVMGIVGGGGYAEYVVTHERAAVPVPAGMSDEAAGGVPEVWMTAFDALFRQMRLSAGETVLIHAVGSGVGTAAVQLAAVAGARTLGTSRTPAKLARAGELGLEVALEGGPEGDWADGVLEATEGRGADVVLDLVGASYVAGNQRVLARGGRWIVVGTPGGTGAEIDLSRLMGRWASLTGTLLRSRPPEEKMALAVDFRRRVVPLFESGRVAPVLDRAFPAAEAAAAHRRMEENRSFGKLVLTW